MDWLKISPETLFKENLNDYLKGGRCHLDPKEMNKSDKNLKQRKDNENSPAFDEIEDRQKDEWEEKLRIAGIIFDMTTIEFTEEFMGDLTRQQIVMANFELKEMERVIQRENYKMGDEWVAYQLSLKHKRELGDCVEYARTEGYKEGYKTGAKDVDLEVAKNLKENGVSHEIIANSTGLTREQVQQL